MNDNETRDSNVLPEGEAMGIAAVGLGEGLGFKDMQAAINMRAWLQRACERHGGKMVGAGFGFGQADIDIELEGCRFNVSIRPI